MAKEELMREKSVEVVNGIYEAFGRGDVPPVLAAMADDLEWYEAEGMPYGGVHHGREAAARNVLDPLAQDIPDFAATPEELIASGDTVAVVAHYTGTGKATGKELDLPSCTLGPARRQDRAAPAVHRHGEVSRSGADRGRHNRITLLKIDTTQPTEVTVAVGLPPPAANAGVSGAALRTRPCRSTRSSRSRSRTRLRS